MKKQRSLHLADRPADDLVGAIMAFVTPPLAAIFADRCRQGQSPDILAEAICLRIKKLARCMAQSQGQDQDPGAGDTTTQNNMLQQGSA